MKKTICFLLLSMSFWTCQTETVEHSVPNETTKQANSQTDAPKAIVSGKLAYPGHLPKDLTIVARNIGTGAMFSSREFNRSTLEYKLQLPAGQYEIFSLTQSRPGQKAYYSDYIRCGGGPNCNSHRPIILDLEAGKKYPHISPSDWAAFNKK